MKQVLIMLGVLLVVMLGYYWVNTRYPIKKAEVMVISDKQIYFEAPSEVKAGEEVEFKMKAKYSEGKLVSYVANFNYDTSYIKILNIEVNKEIFNGKTKVTNDEAFGKVTISGVNSKNRDKLVNGEVLLATLKVKALKKGSSMIYSSRKSETGILSGGKIYEGNFQMPNFKVNFL